MHLTEIIAEIETVSVPLRGRDVQLRLVPLREVAQFSRLYPEPTLPDPLRHKVVSMSLDQLRDALDHAERELIAAQRSKFERWELRRRLWKITHAMRASVGTLGAWDGDALEADPKGQDRAAAWIEENEAELGAMLTEDEVLRLSSQIDSIDLVQQSAKKTIGDDTTPGF